jgi:hypothetical protein
MIVIDFLERSSIVNMSFHLFLHADYIEFPYLLLLIANFSMTMCVLHLEIRLFDLVEKFIPFQTLN